MTDNARDKLVPDIWAHMMGLDQPTTEILAAGLGRVRRWLNRSIIPWTTLQHVVVGDLIADAFGVTRPVDRLAWLFHDVEDVLANDVPSPAKTPAQAEFEQEIRRWVWERTLRLPYPNSRTWAAVREIDTAVLYAEAHTLVPLRMRRPFILEDPEQTELIADLIIRVLDMSTSEAEFHFVRRAAELRDDPTVRALEGRV